MARKKKEELLALPVADNVLLESKFDKEKLRLELESYIDEKINSKFIDEKINEKFIEQLDKTNTKLLKEKSRRIVFKNIFILILLLIIGFLLYILFSNNYFDKYFKKDNNIVIEKDTKEKGEKEEENKEREQEETKKDNKTEEKEEEKEEEKKEEVKEPTLEELIKEYGSLLNNYYVTETSGYLLDFYSANLTDNIKKYITLNSFNFDTIKKEEDYQIISNDTFKIAYEKLFSDTYTSLTFDYGDIKVRYVPMMDSYMTSEILKKDEETIKKEIVDIKVNNNEVTITTIEGIIREDKLYEVVNNTLIDNYKGDSLVNYQDKLNKLIYVFKDGKLIKLEK